MANPKYKTSHSKTRRRRANIRLDVPNAVPCPHCKEAKLPHRVCPSCGKYGVDVKKQDKVVRRARQVVGLES